MNTRTYTFAGRPWTLNAERRGSTHWSATRARTAEWRQAFWALGVQNRHRFGPVDITVHIRQRSPLADTGNAYGAVKAAIDGLVDAGVLTGDTPDIVRSITFHAPEEAARGESETVTLVVMDSSR